MREVELDFITLRLNMAALAVLLGLCGLGVFHWMWVLLGWGSTSFVIACLDLRASSSDSRERQES
jgi:hypothetical protein